MRCTTELLKVRIYYEYGVRIVEIGKHRDPAKSKHMPLGERWDDFMRAAFSIVKMGREAIREDFEYEH
jgi:hypothetical protein